MPLDYSYRRTPHQLQQLRKRLRLPRINKQNLPDFRVRVFLIPDPKQLYNKAGQKAISFLPCRNIGILSETVLCDLFAQEVRCHSDIRFGIFADLALNGEEAVEPGLLQLGEVGVKVYAALSEGPVSYTQLDVYKRQHPEGMSAERIPPI